MNDETRPPIIEEAEMKELLEYFDTALHHTNIPSGVLSVSVKVPYLRRLVSVIHASRKGMPVQGLTPPDQKAT